MTRTLPNILRGCAALVAATAVLALTAACSSSGPDPSASASPSPSDVPSVASDVPLDDQLYDALRAGDAALTTAVLAAGADVNAPLAQGTTAISIAVLRKDPTLVAAVLAANPDLATPDANGMPLLNAACRQGVSGEVAELLIDAGAAIDAPSPDDVGSLPIHECAYSGSSEAIDVLLAHGVDVNARQANYSATPLIVAAWQGHADLVLHLLDEGADPTLTTENGATARKWALVGGYQDVAALLENVGG